MLSCLSSAKTRNLNGKIMICEKCKQKIESDKLSQITKVRMWDKKQKKRLLYHRGCWNILARQFTTKAAH